MCIEDAAAGGYVLEEDWLGEDEESVEETDVVVDIDVSASWSCSGWTHVARLPCSFTSNPAHPK